jgi:hypothetical protein
MLVRSTVMFVVGMSVLSGCTTTNTQTRTGSNSPASTVSSDQPTVSDVYNRKSVVHNQSGKYPEVDLLSIPSGDKIVIQMAPDFNRNYSLCKEAAACQQVEPLKVDTSSKNYGKGDEDTDGSETLIAEVELSEQTKSLFGKKIMDVTQGKKILIMTPDVELSTLTAGGLEEPNALWTSIATNYVTEITTQYLQNIGHSVALYEDKANGVSEKTGQDLINLHTQVGTSILLYQQNPILQLPTLKGGKFDWQLGQTATRLKSGYGADYGLFILLRDSYSSGSRVAAQFLVAALFGAHVQGGQQIGFASLVNLQTGNIEWFNRIHSTSGDLRTFGAAINATDALLQDVPL